MRRRWIWCFLLGTAVCTLAVTRAGCARADAVKESPAPQAADGGKGDEVVLPASLLEAIRAAFPEARVPTRADCAGAWSKRAGKSSPFITWGDFNDDGLEDVALILVGPATRWVVVVFTQVQGGKYSSVAISHGKLVKLIDEGCPEPTRLLMSTIKKGATGAAVRVDASGNREIVDVPMDKDIVVVSVVDSYDTQYRWNGTEFERLALGPE